MSFIAIHRITTATGVIEPGAPIDPGADKDFFLSVGAIRPATPAEAALQSLIASKTEKAPGKAPGKGKGKDKTEKAPENPAEGGKAPVEGEGEGEGDADEGEAEENLL